MPPWTVSGATVCTETGSVCTVCAHGGKPLHSGVQWCAALSGGGCAGAVLPARGQRRGGQRGAGDDEPRGGGLGAPRGQVGRGARVGAWVLGDEVEGREREREVERMKGRGGRRGGEEVERG
eukprot:454224-Rhodomonas_salina.2